MARICDKCERGALKGNTRSHSNISTVVHRKVNLQWKKIGTERMRICTNCIKTMSKNPVKS